MNLNKTKCIMANVRFCSLCGLNMYIKDQFCINFKPIIKNTEKKQRQMQGL